MFRLRLAVAVLSLFVCAAVAMAQGGPGSPLADFAKQDLAERIVRDAERLTGDRAFDPVFRANLMKELLAKSSDQLTPMLSDGKALDPVLAIFGSSTGDLVYTPLPAPCRIYDTRLGSGVQGDGWGPHEPGAKYSVMVASLCGIPRPAAKAVELNFVAASPEGVGNLRAWPWDNLYPSAPNASIVNFNGAMNLANGITVPICNVATATGNYCSYDLFIEPFGHGTHVVIDAVGYFAAPATTTLQMSNVQVSFDAAPQTQFDVLTPFCPTGYTLTGGAMSFSQAPYGPSGAHPVASGESLAYPGKWECAGFNNGSVVHWIGVCKAYCARIPGR